MPVLDAMKPQYDDGGVGNAVASFLGLGVKKRRGRPKKGGNLQPAGAPPSIMGRGNRKKAMHFAV